MLLTTLQVNDDNGRTRNSILRTRNARNDLASLTQRKLLSGTIRPGKMILSLGHLPKVGDDGACDEAFFTEAERFTRTVRRIRTQRLRRNSPVRLSVDPFLGLSESRT
jgi:hypothetical protein